VTPGTPTTRAEMQFRFRCYRTPKPPPWSSHSARTMPNRQQRGDATGRGGSRLRIGPLLLIDDAGLAGSVATLVFHWPAGATVTASPRLTITPSRRPTCGSAVIRRCGRQCAFSQRDGIVIATKGHRTGAEEYRRYAARTGLQPPPRSISPFPFCKLTLAAPGARVQQLPRLCTDSHRR
jgi:hypothetical protein